MVAKMIEKNKKNAPFVILYGPTASGKTDFSLELAQALPIEVINADMGQMYAPLSIGTAKPDWRTQPVVHHLFDIIGEPRNMTVVEYRAVCIQKMNEVWSRGNIPVIVGGSAFYIYALLFPPAHEVGKVHDSKKLGELGDKNLWQQLHEIDPARAQKLFPADDYRIRRALSIWYETGILPSMCNPQYNPPAEYMCMYVGRDRSELYERINARVHIMLQMGWREECDALKGTPWEDFVWSKGVIGYRELFEYDDASSDALVEVIQQRTRRYAKRQICFWNKLSRDIRTATGSAAPIIESNLTLHKPDLYINQLQKWWDDLKKKAHE